MCREPWKRYVAGIRNEFEYRLEPLGASGPAKLVSSLHSQRRRAILLGWRPAGVRPGPWAGGAMLPLPPLAPVPACGPLSAPVRSWLEREAEAATQLLRSDAIGAAAAIELCGAVHSGGSRADSTVAAFAGWMGVEGALRSLADLELLRALDPRLTPAEFDAIVVMAGPRAEGPRGAEGGGAGSGAAPLPAASAAAESGGAAEEAAEEAAEAVKDQGRGDVAPGAGDAGAAAPAEDAAAPEGAGRAEKRPRDAARAASGIVGGGAVRPRRAVGQGWARIGGGARLLVVERSLRRERERLERLRRLM